MANILKLLVRRTLFSHSGNLASFDEPYRRMAQLLRARKVTGILDAGASTGRISRRLLRLFPEARVYAFEPNPLYADALRAYAVEDPRFQPQFAALSDKEDIAELNITRSPGSASLFVPGANLTEMYPADSQVNAVERVETVTLDRWAERQGDPPLQLMKFDIQGGELKALEGASRILRTSTLLVYTEILFNPLYQGGAVYSEIDLFLRKCGFILFDIFKPRYHRDGKLLWANALFVHAERMGV